MGRFFYFRYLAVQIDTRTQKRAQKAIPAASDHPLFAGCG